MNNIDNLYLLAPSSHVQMMGFVYRYKNSLIVIDGGTKEDYPELLRIIKENNSVIDLLIVTHCHHDHIGALVPLLQNKDIEIKKIVFDFPTLKTIKSILATDWEYKTVLEFLKAVKNRNFTILNPRLLKNYQIDGFIIRFLKLGDIHHHDLNDSSLVFTLKTATKTILFTGDISPKMSDKLAKKYGKTHEFSCDYIQLAHHGQSGGSKKLYELTQAKYAFWCAPKWLYDNDLGNGENTGPFTSAITKEWLSELDIKPITAFYKTVIINQNNICFE